MNNPIKNLFAQTESILLEGLVDDVVELINIEKEVAEDAIKGLSFANYLELGNAIDIDDAETAKEILKITGSFAKINFPPTLDETPDDEYEHQDTLLCDLCGSRGYDRNGNTCPKCGGQGRVTLDGEYIDEDRYEDETDECINCAGQGVDYQETCFNCGGKGRVMKDNSYIDDEWKNSLYEADRPTATELGQPAKPGIAPVGSTAGIPGAKAAAKTDLSIGGPDLKQPDQAKQPEIAKPVATIQEPPAIDDQDIERKEINDLQVGDEIEVADIGGQPATAKVMSINGPGNTLVVRGEKQTDHMIKKDSVLATPIIQVQEARQARLGKKNKRTKRMEGKKQKDIYEIDINAMREAYEKALEGMPDLDRYLVYINRPDVDYVMYHIPRSQAKEGEPRFLKVDKATGNWQTQEWKRNNEPAIQQGEGSGPHTVDELNEDTQASPIKALRAILQGEGIGTGRGYNDKNIGNRKIRVYTSDLKNQNVKELERIVQKGMEDAGYSVRKVLVSFGREDPSIRDFSKPQSGKFGFEATIYPNVVVWLEGNPVGSRYQTELDEVAPPGMEGWIKKRKPEFKKRYGDRWEEVLYATAWKQKNNESIEKDINEALHFFVDPISNGMFEVRNNRGDLHDTYDDGKQARQVAADLNAQHNKVEEGFKNTIVDKSGDRVMTPMGAGTVIEIGPDTEETVQRVLVKLDIGDFEGDTFKFDIFSLSRLDKDINESWYGDEAGRELKIGSLVTAANGQSGEVRKFINLYHHGRSAKVRFYGSPDQYFYVAVDSNNKIRRREIDPGESIHEDTELLRLKELAGLSEGYGNPFQAPRRALKSGVFKSKAIGNTVKIMGPADSNNDEHRGEIGVITNARREPTFSQMRPFFIMYSVELESGEKIYIRRENIRKVKTQVDVTEARRGNETNKQEMSRLKRELKRSSDKNEQQYLRLEIRKLQGEIDLRRERAIKETASAGSTSAGAIASSPVAMNGMQSRNSSIYGQTKLHKKPTPKKRPTREEAGEGIGRSKKN